MHTDARPTTAYYRERPMGEHTAAQDEELRVELLALAAEDQRVRAELLAEGTLFEGYRPRMAEVHHRNGVRLSAIMDRVGWPGRRLVGAEAADAAWLVLQHSVGDPAVMRRGLALVRAAPADDVAPAQVAMLDDRVRVLSGLPQRYGTQFDWDAQGVMSPWDIEDPDRVDERRRAAGLPPLAEKLREIRDTVAREGEAPPADMAARRREIEQWARSVGWRA
jgi:hypothetical protein